MLFTFVGDDNKRRFWGPDGPTLLFLVLCAGPEGPGLTLFFWDWGEGDFGGILSAMLFLFCDSPSGYPPTMESQTGAGHSTRPGFPEGIRKR